MRDFRHPEGMTQRSESVPGDTSAHAMPGLPPNSPGGDEVAKIPADEPTDGHRGIARLYAVLVLMGLMSSLVWGYLFSDVSASFEVPDAQIEILKWASVAAWGLASVCFSYYRTLDGLPKVQRVVRVAGGHLLIGAMMTVLALVWSVSVRALWNIDARLPAEPPSRWLYFFPVGLVVISGIFAVISLFAGLFRLLEAAWFMVNRAGEDNIADYGPRE